VKEEIEKIRELLNTIEKSDKETDSDSVKKTFDLFELPQIIKDITDFLQPSVTPYGMVIYWYMFRNSIVETGDVYIRASNAKIAKGIGTKFAGLEKQSARFGEGAVTDNLRLLDSIGAIKKVGDTNRDGTLYRIFLPEEIEICKEKMKLQEKESLPIIDPKKELDYYNIKENKFKIFERDEYKCYKCGKQLTRFSATLDHINPVSKGGDNSYDNLVTCCLHDNSNRRATPISDFLA
jgi:hypothetical protein